MLKYLGKVQGFSQRTDTDDLWRSPVTQSSIRSDLEEFHLVSKTKPDDPLLALAVHQTYDSFRLAERVKPLHLNDVFLQDLNIWYKSPGLPWRDYGYKTNDDIRKDPDAVRRVQKFAHLIKNGRDIHFPDCLAYVRSHTCKRGELKVRAVWGYPATVTFIEAMFAVPLIRAYQKKHPNYRPMAYGFETANGGMKRLIKRFMRNDMNYVGFDFKKFDKTVPPWLICIAFDILLLNLTFCEYEDYGVPDARKLIVLYYSIRNYFVNTTIRTANGCRFKKFSGIPSGSYFTQLIGSIANTIVINWLSLTQFSVFPVDLITLGEHSFLSSTRKWDFEYCDKLLSSIGMKLNLEKSDQSTNLHRLMLLGYQINEGQPFKACSEWMAALLYTEKPDKEKKQN